MSPQWDRLTVTSETFSRERLGTILRKAKPFFPDAHVIYPADERGQHLRGFFAIEPVARRPEFVACVRDDILAWIHREGIDFEILFAPAQPAVRVLADSVARAAGKATAYWEYLPSGRFGTHLVDGEIDARAQVLVFNVVSHTGRCVGQRLPEFVESLGGRTVAAAVFVKGTVPKVRETEARMGARFHSSLQVDVPVYPSADCPMCRAGGPPPIPWNHLVAGRNP